jgi:hypothetical protein
VVSKPTHGSDSPIGDETPGEVHDGMISEQVAAGESHKQRDALVLLQERRMRGMLQEEVIPCPGSIYPRTMTPGPGYYGVPSIGSPRQAPSFYARRKGCIDMAVDEHRTVPAPGTYEHEAAADGKAKKKQGGNSFGTAAMATLMTPAQTMRKLPFISTTASLAEAPCVCSPSGFHSITPEATNRTGDRSRGAAWTFSKMRRPF